MFYFIRHGEPDWQLSVNHKMSGLQSNFVGLTETGKAEIEEAAQDERLKSADIIVASPYTRAMHTAAILSRRLDLDIEVEFLLHEWLTNINLNISKNKKFLHSCYDEYFESDGQPTPDSLDLWESADMIKTRVKMALEKYKNRDKVIVACHEVIIRTITGRGPLKHGEIVEWEMDKI